MKWTKKVPTEPGYYWFRSDIHPPQPVNIERWGRSWSVEFFGGEWPSYGSGTINTLRRDNGEFGPKIELEEGA